MKKTSITEERLSRYVKKYLENSCEINYSDLTENNKLEIYSYEDLPNTEVNGYPLASEYVAKDGASYSTKEYMALSAEEKKACLLRYHYLPYSHELYVGTTGSGKTTGCIEPQLRAISAQKNKPNLFITDPKGELFEHNSRHLEQNGYKIFVLNFKDITHSHKWNPILELYDKKMQSIQLKKGCKLKMGLPKKNLELFAPIEEFNGEAYVEYQGKAFPSGTSCDAYIGFLRDMLEAEIEQLLNSFVCTIIKVQSQKDPSWEYGAQQLLKGILLCMLEDAATPNSGFTKDMMTLRTVQHYYNRLRADIVSENGGYTVETHPLLKNKSARTKSYLLIAMNNARNTMLSYCGVFDGAVKDWFQGHIFALTTGSNVDLNSDDKPYAIFVITRDYDKSDFTVAGMFIDWVYREALKKADKAEKGKDGKPTTRPLHFLLDEFANIPAIPDFENKISTSRSRNIWFHLVVQSYEQINLVYSDERATVICDNCNAQVFLGAQSRQTKQKFSDECGKRSVPSYAASVVSDNHTLTEVPVLPVSSLDLINEGEMYVKRLYLPVIKSQFIRSYVCAGSGDFKNFYDDNPYSGLTPVNAEPFNAPRYTFAPLLTRPKDE